MNTLRQRITLLFAVINLVVVGTLPAQSASDQGVRQALAERETEVAQKQAEAAQKQSQAAQKRMEAEQTQVKLASMFAQSQAPVGVAPVPATPPGPAEVSANVPSISFKGAWPSRSGAGSVLVIPREELTMEELSAMTEDMTVMSRIFEKNLEQARIATARGRLFVSSHDALSMLLGGGGGALQSMYLQGYGALFLLKVDFPLSPSPQIEEEPETEKKEKGDPVWEETRQQMFEPQEAAKGKPKEQQPKYDPEQVETLKTTLVKALKHAANIRSLKPDESVVLVVAGSGVSASETMMTSRRMMVTSEQQARIVHLAPGGSSQTLLIIRAKKSDIDSFAKNEDYEQFRQRTQLLSCPYLGAEAGHGDPFLHGYY